MTLQRWHLNSINFHFSTSFNTKFLILIRHCKNSLLLKLYYLFGLYLFNTYLCLNYYLFGPGLPSIHFLDPFSLFDENLLSLHAFIALKLGELMKRNNCLPFEISEGPLLCRYSFLCCDWSRHSFCYNWAIFVIGCLLNWVKINTVMLCRYSCLYDWAIFVIACLVMQRCPLLCIHLFEVCLMLS